MSIRKIVVILLLCSIGIVVPVDAQPSYPGEAILVSYNQGVAILKSTGVHSKKKKALEVAAKTAIYTYLVSGVEGLNNGRPLIDDPVAASNYLTSLLEKDGYQVYVKDLVALDKPSRQHGVFRVEGQLSLYIDALTKDVERKGFAQRSIEKISLEETQETIALPSIMVIPYHKEGVTYEESFAANPYLRVAMSKLQEAFVKQGVEVKDFETELNILNRTQAYNIENSGSNDDVLARSSGADVSVVIDVSVQKVGGGKTVTVVLSAKDNSTGNTYASKTNTSKKFASTPVEQVTSLMIDGMCGDFLKDLSSRMANKLNAGNTIAIEIVLDPNATVNFDTEFGDKRLPLSDMIRLWIRDNAVDGHYNLRSRTAGMLYFDGVQIPNKDNYGVNDFALRLYLYLRQNKISIKRNVENNIIRITINS